jgi:hypothetical protein
MYVFKNPYQEPFDKATAELAQLEIALRATNQRVEAITNRMKHLHHEIAALKVLLQNSETSFEHYQTLSALCETVLSAKAGLPMTVPEVMGVIAQMGITLQYSNPGAALHTTLRRLGAKGEKKEGGVHTLLPGMLWQEQLVPPGPPRFYWDPAYPPPSPMIEFPSVV